MRRFAAVSLALACAGMLTACGQEPPAHTDPNYVALGDSFASMSTADDATAEDFCARSKDNYPSLVARDLGLQLADASCQGAVSADLITGREDDGGMLPPQVNAINAGTRLVTMTIGANDINLGGLDFCTSSDGDCQAQLGADTDAALQALPAQLDPVFAEIARRAPDATVVVTGYYPVITARDACEAGVSPADKGWMDDVHARINTLLADEAARHHALFVLPEDAGAHATCAPLTERWTSMDGLGTSSFGQHPTPLGQQVMARAIEYALAEEG